MNDTFHQPNQHRNTTNPNWAVAFEQHIPHPGLALDITPRQLAGFSVVQSVLRGIHLQNNDRILPYEHATIEPKEVRISDLSPLSLYALNGQLRQQTNMFWHLLTHDNQCLFNLTGFLDYQQGGKAYRLAPIIVETFVEPTTGRLERVIIDGLHRVMVARTLGFSAVWVIEITSVPPELLPIALPVSWSDVVACDAVPPTDRKRRYRYKKLSDLPATILPLATRENFMYFLYRDFGPLGSTGIRPAGD